MLQNFEAAAALNFAYYNFVKTHGSSKMTSAIADGVEKRHWMAAKLVERRGN